MSHPAQIAFVTAVSRHLPQFFTGALVLEVGSLNINGSVRHLYHDCDYVGVDLAPGRDVDVVGQGQKLCYPDGLFDVVSSFEAMEHNPYWEATVDNMLRMLKPGGLFMLSCASTGRPEHGTSSHGPQDSPFTVELGWNHYHNITIDEFQEGVELSVFDAYQIAYNDQAHDLYVVAIKHGPLPAPELDKLGAEIGAIRLH